VWLTKINGEKSSGDQADGRKAIKNVSVAPSVGQWELEEF
jgi:hypothetical protein